MLVRGDRSVENFKMIFSKFYEMFIPHFSKLIGQCAAIQIQIISHLLTVKRNVKLIGSVFAGFGGQIRPYAAADMLGNGMVTLLGQFQILLPQNPHQICDQLWIPACALVFDV